MAYIARLTVNELKITLIYFGFLLQNKIYLKFIYKKPKERRGASFIEAHDDNSENYLFLQLSDLMAWGQLLILRRKKPLVLLAFFDMLAI